MTKPTTTKTAPVWHHLDAKDQILGRLATQAAMFLMGKTSPAYVPHAPNPVYVVVTNTDQVVLTGDKEDQKMYRHFSGYPGGLRERSVREQRRRDSRVIIEQAIYGMLPKNNLRAVRMRRLKLYAGADHPHLPQLNPPA